MPANVESMFYVNDMPWHREGVPLDDPPNTISAIKHSGLDWKVSKVKLFSEDKKLVEGYYGIKRNDTGDVLGIVKGGYTPLQNSEAFNFFDPLISNKFIQYETAGALGKGETIWILAKIKQNTEIRINGDDIVNKYLLLSNSHDGQSAVSVKFTPIRVVCQNTLNVALDRGETTKIRHITSIHKKLEDVNVAVENIIRIYSRAEENFKSMFRHKIDDIQVKEYFNRIYPVIDEKNVSSESQYKKREANIRIQQQLMVNFTESFGVKNFGIGGTLWAAYNAVTEFIDHPSGYKLGDNKLLKRIWFGEGESIKEKAYIEALNFIRAA